MGIFHELAPKYWERGYSVFPVKSYKKPGDQRKSILPPAGWSQWCFKIPDREEQKQLLSRYGDFGITLACGPASKIVFIDVDAPAEEFPEVDKIVRENLPDSPVERVGSKGFASCYRYTDDLDFPQFKCVKENREYVLVELLNQKRHCIIPPTIHGDTDQPYFWTQDELIDYRPEELPLLTQKHLDHLRDVLNGYVESKGYQLNDEKVSKAGRNNELKKLFATYLAQGLSFDQVFHLLDQHDKKCENPLFSDPNENIGGDEWRSYNIQRFMFSQYKSINERRKRHGSGPEFFKVGKPEVETESSCFYFKNQDGEINWRLPDYNGYAKYFRNKYNARSGPQLTYIWNESFYRQIEQAEFESILYKETNSNVRVNHLSNFYRISRAANFGEQDLIEPTGFLNLKNGVFDLEKRKLVPRNKNLFFLNELPVAYDPDAECNKFEWYLNDVFDGDADLALMLQMFMGHVIMQGKPKLHKAAVLFGEGQNGKSTFLNIVQELFGDDNVSNISMSNLNHQFSLVGLQGKFLNMVDETPAKATLDSESFKTVVSGGKIQAAYKGIDSFFMTVQARFMFSCNDFPRFQDTSYGLYRRILIIPFLKTIQKPDPGLEDTIIKNELPGVLNWILEGYRLLVNNSYVIPEARSAVECKEDYMIESDSVRAFVKDGMRKCEPIIPYSAKDLWSSYESWCRDLGKYPVSFESFSKRLSMRVKHYYSDVKSQKTNGKAHYKGIEPLRK